MRIKYVWALLFVLTMAATVFGQDSTPDVTENPAVVVTAEATAPVEVPSVGSVENGGTVIINETPVTTPESDVSIVAKLSAAVLSLFLLLRYGVKALIVLLDKITANTTLMTLGEAGVHMAPSGVREQGTGLLDDAEKLQAAFRKAWLELNDDVPIAAKRLSDATTKPVVIPPEEPQG